MFTLFLLWHWRVKSIVRITIYIFQKGERNNCLSLEVYRVGSELWISHLFKFTHLLVFNRKIQILFKCMVYHMRLLNIFISSFTSSFVCVWHMNKCCTVAKAAWLHLNSVSCLSFLFIAFHFHFLNVLLVSSPTENGKKCLAFAEKVYENSKTTTKSENELIYVEAARWNVFIVFVDWEILIGKNEALAQSINGFRGNNYWTYECWMLLNSLWYLLYQFSIAKHRIKRITLKM